MYLETDNKYKKTGDLMNRTFFILVIVLFSIFPLFAGDSETISYNECVNIALQNNSQIAYMKEMEKAAIASYNIANSANKVGVDASMRTVEVESGTVSSSEISVPGIDKDFGIFAGVTASYGVFIPGRQAAIDISKRALYITKINAKKQIDSVISLVQDKYYSFIMARNNVKVTKTIVERYEILLKKLRIRASAGDVRILELNKVEVTYDQFLLDFERAKQAESNAKSELFLAMGIEEYEGEVVLDETLVLSELKYNFDELLKIALVLSPDLSIAKINKEISRQKVIAAQQKHLPTVGAFFSLGYENTQIAGVTEFTDNFKSNNWDPSVHAGVTMSMPIYSGGAISGAVAKARADYNKSVYEEKSSILKLKKELKVNYEKLIFLKKQLEISIRTLENAKRGLDMTEKSYNSGMVGLYEVNEASENVIKTESVVLKYKVEYIKTVTAISHLIGVNEADICLN